MYVAGWVSSNERLVRAELDASRTLCSSLPHQEQSRRSLGLHQDESTGSPVKLK